MITKHFSIDCYPSEEMANAAVAVLQRYRCENVHYSLSYRSSQEFTLIANIDPEELVMMELYGGFARLVVAEYTATAAFTISSEG